MNLYLVTKITDLSAPYDTTEEGSLDLVGVFNNKKDMYQALKNLDLKKEEDSVFIDYIKLNEISHDPETKSGLIELYGWLDFNDFDDYDDY